MMHTLSRRFLLSAIAAGVVGMSMGIYMGVSQDHSLAHVHAHVNLLGWVSLALYGLVYQAAPALAAGRLPQVQFWLSVLGPLAMCGGLAARGEGIEGMFPLIGGGALVTAGGMAAFAAIVAGARRLPAGAAAPAAVAQVRR
jgi:hypothetical protein